MAAVPAGWRRRRSRHDLALRGRRSPRDCSHPPRTAGCWSSWAATAGRAALRPSARRACTCRPFSAATPRRSRPAAPSSSTSRPPSTPIAHLSRLPKGEYHVQAVFDYNRDLRLPEAPLNLVSDPVKVTLDPAQGGTVKLELTRKLPADEPPKEHRSGQAAEVPLGEAEQVPRPADVPADGDHPAAPATPRTRTDAIRCASHIGGFGTRYTAVLGMMDPESDFREAVERADDAAHDPRAPRRRRAVRRSVPGQLGQQRPLWRRRHAGADPLSSRRPIAASARATRACWRALPRAAGCRWRCRSSIPISSTAPGRTLPTRSISAPSS